MVVKKRGMIVVVLSVFLLLLSSFVVSQASCILYPRTDIAGTFLDDLYCVEYDEDAQAQCADDPECDEKTYVISQSCSALSECVPVTCNIDCLTHPAGFCTSKEVGGQAVSDEEYELWCTAGCCKIPTTPTSYCSFLSNKYLCDQKADQSGIANYDFYNPTGLTKEQCASQYCKVEIQTATLTVSVNTEEGQPIAGASVMLKSAGLEKKTDSLGVVTFTGLSPKTEAITASAAGYVSEMLTLSLNPGQSAEQKFTLVVKGTATISGVIKDVKNNLLAGSTLSWTGPESGFVTSTDGSYSIEVSPGEYQITASKIGYSADKKTISVAAKDALTLDLVLTATIPQGVQGTAYVDVNGNNQPDDGETTYGVKLYVDGVFKGYSQFPDGDFNLEIATTGEHTIAATYQDYVSEKKTITVLADQTVSQNVLLIRLVGECTEPGTEKDVGSLVVSPVPGKEQLKVEWVKPCPEVIGYTLQRVKGATVEKSFEISPFTNSFIDTTVSWGEEYTYQIAALYDKGRKSNPVSSNTINVGNQACEGKYHDNSGWETFCLVGTEEERKQVWTCNDQNLLTAWLCEGEYSYCAKISPRQASCKNAAVCSLGGDPFGLYYVEEMCYGTNDPSGGKAANYCYYDSTTSIINQCKSCTQIESCFDYQSKDACEINSCLTKNCQWVDSAEESLLVDYSLINLNLPGLVTQETGAGYCVEENYEKDDKCSLCGPDSPPSTLFENFYCTAEVCSSLGRCFSAPGLTSCQNCGETPTAERNCYTYETELECTGGQSVQKGADNQFTFSSDQCGWQRCLWQGSSNGAGASCVKDGNGDALDDCAGFIGSELAACRNDVSPPRTELSSQPTLSLAFSNLTFTGDDSFHEHAGQRNPLGSLWFCLTKEEANAPSICSQFKEVLYPGKLQKESVTVNIVGSLEEKTKAAGDTYRLQFYSTDKFLNQEALQEAFVLIDNVPPEFNIQETIDTVGEITTLTAYLEGTTELMSCTFTLTPVLPSGSSQIRSISREEKEKQAIFENLDGIVYTLEAACTDDQGNKNTKKKSYTFDVEKRIDIVYPPLQGAVAEQEVVFKIHTLAPASCALYDAATKQKLRDFTITDDVGKEHETEPLPLPEEREYVAEQEVLCKELLTGETYNPDYFHFFVDRTAPKTQVLLREEQREEQPTSLEWEEFFVNTVAVDFECAEETGFGCEETYYCLEENSAECEFFIPQRYTQYVETVLLTNSTRLCYYSTDSAGNLPLQVVCGKVLIDGYGLVMEKPPQHYYQNTLWGVSDKPVFDWQFFTKIPTKECRFDFVPGFNYDATPPHRTRTANEEKKYLFQNFPESVFTSFKEDEIKTVYVQCKNNEDELGPEQKIILEYDPTSPKVTDAHAEPDEVFEGVTTTLFVTTDDKTICRYSDTGHTTYETMSFSFPGADEKILNKEHKDTYTLNYVGDTGIKDYLLNVQCKNGAGVLSEVEEIQVHVDYTKAGFIRSLNPSGFIGTKNVTLSVQTSKNAVCEYKFSDKSFSNNKSFSNKSSTPSYLPFATGAGTTVHTAPLPVLEEKEHVIPVKCQVGDQPEPLSEQIVFTVDLTPPVITAVDDGTFTCGNNNLKIIANSQEKSIAGYYYELYDIGSTLSSAAPAFTISPFTTSPTTSPFTSSLSTSLNISGKNSSSPIFVGDEAGEILVRNGTIGKNSSFTIFVGDLDAGRTYKVKVLAQDEAGNVGVFKDSDGFTIISKNDSRCAVDEVPVVTFTTDAETCTDVSLQMSCDSSVGCNEWKYGTHSSAELCLPAQEYNGQKISFTNDGAVCYYVVDNAGKNWSGVKETPFNDADGDHISDSCDECPSTDAGKIANEIGCADGQVPANQKFLDNDGDGLPNVWEGDFNALNCQLDSQNKDTDGNGKSDAEEDYDGDGYTNLREYSSGLNPCLADAPTLEVPLVTEEQALTLTMLLAWVFLLLGLLLLLGGSGYLIYYYLYSPQAKVPARPVVRGLPGVQVPGQPSLVKKTWRDQFTQLQKMREEKRKEKKRQELFAAFGKQSAQIPHVAEILQKKAPHLPRLDELAHRYQQDKAKISPGLRPEEKDIFSKLENIARQTEQKKIEEVVSKDEAKDIFTKLKEISKKRKEGAS